MGLSYARVLQQAPRAALPALVTFTAALAVYFRTLYPTVGPGDSGELALAAATLGVPHPPGYPLYVLVGRAFESLPFGDPAARANVMSACFGALAAATLCLGVRRAGLCFPPGVQGPAGRLTVWRTVGEEIPGVAAGLLFAYSLAAWRVSIRAEVFAPFAFVCALLLLGAVSWFLPGGQEPGGERAAGERGAAGETPRPVARRWGRWWLLAGVGIVCHQSMLFFAAPLGVAIGSVLPRDFSLVRRVAWAAAGLAAGLLPYLLLIPLSLRDPGLDWGDPETVERLLAVVTRREFGATTLTADAASSYDAAALSRQAEALGVGLTRHLSWAGLGAALLGGIVLWRRSRRLWLGLAGSFAASGVFFFVLLALPYDPFASAGIDLMRREVVERFFVAPELLLCFAAGLGCAAWTRWRPVASAGRGGMRRWGVALPILLPAFLLWRHFPDADASNRYYFRDLGENVLRTVPPEAIIFRRDSTAVFATWCLQQAEGMRPDVVVITPPEARGGQTREWYVRQVRRRRPEILAGAVEFNAIEARLRETFPPAADGAEHLVYAVCARNIGRRPVYFDEFVPPLADHLVPEGILYRLLAVPLSPAERVLALGLGAEVLERQYRYRGLYALEAVENDGACRRAIFTYSAAHASFAREYLSLARLDRALHHALEAVRMHSQWPPHHRLLASVYRALGDDEAAAEHEARDRALMPLFRNLLEPGS